MTLLAASAPGKIVVCGDYAVLAGAPAVVLAVDRRARLEWLPDRSGTLRVRAPDVGVTQACARSTGQGIAWEPAAAAASLTLVTKVLQTPGLDGDLPSGCLTLDTSRFFLDTGGTKLGLGSSAAVLVLLAAWLAHVRGKPAPPMEALVALHRQQQGGRGSGVDVAASLHGGLLAYQTAGGVPVAEPMEWAPDLLFACMWSGASASTGSALARLADWREHHLADYRAHMDGLGDLARTVAAAFGRGDAPVIMDGMSAYADALHRLGEASGIDIVTAQHRAMIDLARECGAVYKSCGAGGGDVGMALARDADVLQRFLARAATLGFAQVKLGRAPVGLQVLPDDAGEGGSNGQRSDG